MSFLSELNDRGVPENGNFVIVLLYYFNLIEPTKLSNQNEWCIFPPLCYQ